MIQFKLIKPLHLDFNFLIYNQDLLMR